MLIGVGFVKVGPAQVAEMCIAFEADHMVASMRLLSSGVASRARLRMKLHVVFGGHFLGCKLKSAAGKADEIFTVPTGFADFTKSEIAVFADCEAFGRRR